MAVASSWVGSWLGWKKESEREMDHVSFKLVVVCVCKGSRVTIAGKRDFTL